MASLTFPLSLATFQDTLRLAEWQMDLVEPVQVSQTAGGTPIRASLGEALWRGSFRLILQTHAEAAAAEAILSLAARPGASVLLYDPRHQRPASGGSLTGSSPLLQAVSTDRREISIAGLPNAYVLTRGDLLAFTYGSSPTRYALHRVITTRTASALGLVTELEVIPAIRAGFTTGAAVTLVKPVFKAVLSNVSNGTGRTVVTDGATVEFVQTLR